MADVKISQLPAATTPLAGTEEVPLVQGGVTKKATVDDIVAAAAGGVTSVTGTAPVVSSGGTTPAISMAAATGSVNGYLTSTDWTTFNSKQPAGSYLTNGGALGTPSSGTATNLTGLPLSTGVTGTLPVANGGTGTATPSLVQGTNITITGTWPNQTINASGSAAGDVSGPGSSTDNAIARFDGTTGKIIQNSGVQINDSGEINVGVWKGTEVGLSYGGTGASTAAQARGNILPSYSGNAGKVLAVNSGATDVEYISAGGTGTVTSVDVSGGTTGLTTSGGPVTAAGTITLAGTLAVANGGTGATTAGTALSNLGGIGSATSSDGSITVSQVGTNIDLTVSAASPASTLLTQVRNTTGATLTKGTVVYISGATGQIATVSKALATSDATSAQTLGMITADLANNTNGYVTVFGLIEDIDTSAYADGAQLYLSGVTAGAVTATKPSAPIHLVYVAVVEYSHAVHGKLLVKVQNGYELDEIHDVAISSPVTGQTIVYNSGTSLWSNSTVSLTAGVNGTLPIANGGSGQTTAQTAMNAFAGAVTSGSYLRGNGTNVVMSTIQAADVPTLNQNTSGTAAGLSATLAVGSGGTGATSLTVNNVVLGNGTSPVQLVAPGTSGNVLTSNGTTWSSTAPAAQAYPGSGIAVSTGSAWTTSLTAPSGTIVGTTDTQTLTNKTFTGYTETVYALSGTAIDPANGTIQTKTLSGATTFTESLADGQSVVLMVNPSTYAITWPTITWINTAGSGAAPTLEASSMNVIVLWQVASTLYGNWVGSA